MRSGKEYHCTYIGDHIGELGITFAEYVGLWI